MESAEGGRLRSELRQILALSCEQKAPLLESTTDCILQGDWGLGEGQALCRLLCHQDLSCARMCHAQSLC